MTKGRGMSEFEANLLNSLLEALEMENLKQGCMTLACELTGYTLDEVTKDSHPNLELDNRLEAKYGIETDGLEKLIKDLLPMIGYSVNEQGKLCYGFAVEEDGQRRFLVRQEIKQSD